MGFKGMKKVGHDGSLHLLASVDLTRDVLFLTFMIFYADF